MMYLWLAIALGTLMLEIGHPGLFLFLSFALGAGSAALAAFFAFSLTTQIIFFIVYTIISILVLQQLAHLLHHKEIPTNAQALQGKCGIVIKHIAAHAPGQVKVNGEIWTARSYDARSFEPNTHVLIVRVLGSHVIVTGLQPHGKDIS